MDNRHFGVPGTRHTVWVDLDDRDGLTEKEVLALSTEIERLVKERDSITERIRKINKRLLLSIEREEDDGPQS